MPQHAFKVDPRVNTLVIWTSLTKKTHFFKYPTYRQWHSINVKNAKIYGNKANLESRLPRNGIIFLAIFGEPYCVTTRNPI